ncbi:MAG TPA: FAD-dependent oxidoreductase, partial [Ilumatobacteraceae bacterium]
ERPQVHSFNIKETAVSNSTIMPRRAEQIAHWHMEADVVVVGYGIAGAAAALEAAQAGASVLVIERSGGWGGASALSGGYIYLGGGTAVQKACGFDDDPDEMFKFLMAAMGPGSDEAKTRIYCDESVELFEWLLELGVTFNHTAQLEPAWEAYRNEGLMYTGGENAWPYNEIARPAPRGHRPPTGGAAAGGEHAGGRFILEPIVRRAESHGVEAVYNTKLDALVLDRDGRVAGVAARRFGEEVLVRARQGVVLAAGTFVYNRRMVARHAPWILDRAASAIEEHEGGAILAAQAIGAEVAHMDACEVASPINPPVLIRGMLVNGVGQRFINEDTYPGRLAQIMLFKHDNAGFGIVDERCIEEGDDPLKAKLPDYPFLKVTSVCETLAELEHELGLPPGSLETSVGLYNRNAARGEDPMFHKAARWLRPLEPPFGAFSMSGTTSGFTLGGLVTTVDAEVLHVGGDPIPGLYAAGRTSSGIPAWGYASGASLGDGAFFGRKAGKAIAKL